MRVYKNVDDVFPLVIPGWEGSLKAVAKVHDKVNAEIKGERASKIHGLLFALDKSNNGMMLIFRGAYVGYQNDPCRYGDFFERELTKILDYQRRFKSIELQIDALIEMARLQPHSSEEFTKAFARVVDRMGAYVLPEVTAERVKEARQIAKGMTEDEDEG